MRISDWSSDVCSSDLELDMLNEERRAIEAGVQEAAEAIAAAKGNRAVAVIAGQGWHPGVIGIVAGRLKEKTGRPAIVIALDENGVGKGSGRSIAGVDLGAAVLAAKDTGRSEEHTSELQSLMRISYAVFCLKKKNTHNTTM